jgi:phosphate transport system permease protein
MGTRVRSGPGRERAGEWTYGVLVGLGAASAPVCLAGIVAVLAAFAWPAIVWNGWGFFTSLHWQVGNTYGGPLVVRGGYAAPQGAAYGMLVFAVGTVLSALLAMVLATPVALGAAVALAEYAGPRLGAILGFFVELIAGVPSVVFGLWGFVVLVPWIGRGLGPLLARWLGFIPFLAGPVASGAGLLASGIVLAAMILPIITAVSRDAIAGAPAELREQGRALGLTDWEVLRGLVLPVAWPGIRGAVTLALGRALGETMAVLMVSGGAAGYLPRNLYSPIATVAANIVALLDSAMTDPTGMALHALAELALVLTAITVGVNLLAPPAARRRSWT